MRGGAWLRHLWHVVATLGADALRIGAAGIRSRMVLAVAIPGSGAPPGSPRTCAG
jgi:hypothetical protein